MGGHGKRGVQSARKLEKKREDHWTEGDTLGAEVAANRKGRGEIEGSFAEAAPVK